MCVSSLGGKYESLDTCSEASSLCEVKADLLCFSTEVQICAEGYLWMQCVPNGGLLQIISLLPLSAPKPLCFTVLVIWRTRQCTWYFSIASWFYVMLGSASSQSLSMHCKARRNHTRPSAALQRKENCVQRSLAQSPKRRAALGVSWWGPLGSFFQKQRVVLGSPLLYLTALTMYSCVSHAPYHRAISLSAWHGLRLWAFILSLSFPYP